MSRQIFRGRPFPSLGLHMSAPMAVPMRMAPSGVRQASIIPPIARPSFWKSLVPKALKARWADKTTKKPRSREWNPATFFIAIFILIGSMSIQMIALQKNFAEFMRQSDVRIGLLREVVERIQRGEEVDVEKALGTGDPEREVEWQEGKYFRPSRGGRALVTKRYFFFFLRSPRGIGKRRFGTGSKEKTDRSRNNRDEQGATATEQGGPPFE